jgi:hypothetical protein
MCLGYATQVNDVYWLVLDSSLDNGLKQLKVDSDVLQMVNAAKSNEGLIHVYYDHPVEEPEIVGEVEAAEIEVGEVAHEQVAGAGEEVVKTSDQILKKLLAYEVEEGVDEEIVVEEGRG